MPNIFSQIKTKKDKNYLTLLWSFMFIKCELNAHIFHYAFKLTIRYKILEEREN